MKLLENKIRATPEHTVWILAECNSGSGSKLWSNFLIDLRIVRETIAIVQDEFHMNGIVDEAGVPEQEWP